MGLSSYLPLCLKFSDARIAWVVTLTSLSAFWIRARSCAAATDVVSAPSRVAIIPTTTSSSTSVKPRLFKVIGETPDVVPGIELLVRARAHHVHRVDVERAARVARADRQNLEVVRQGAVGEIRPGLEDLSRL